MASIRVDAVRVRTRADPVTFKAEKDQPNDWTIQVPEELITAGQEKLKAESPGRRRQ